MSTQHHTLFYVSTQGNDAWSGRLPEPNAEGSDGPFASVARARAAIRALPAKERVAHPITILIRGGTYYLPETLVFTPEDSGTFACPITYEAYPGEEPVLSGGRPIETAWRPWRGEVRVCQVPDAADRGWTFRRLIVNGKARRRARLPDEGYYRIVEPVGEAAFRYREGDIRPFHNLQDAEAVVFHSWNESRLRIKGLDEGERVVRFTGAPERSHYFGWPGAHGPNRYYIENVREGLTQPGEWYLDYQSGELYYWPEEDLDRAVVVAPALTQVLRFDADPERGRRVQYLRFRGLTFGDTDWTLPDAGYPGCGDVGDIVEPATVALTGAWRCSIEDCTIRNTGAYGLEVVGPGNTISGNHIHDTGSGGIITRNYGGEVIIAAYNHIHDCGAVYPSAVGINIDDGGGIFQHNLIHDIAHSGIYSRHWATDHQPLERQSQEEGLVIAYNEIYRVMSPINDGAGIFVRDSDMHIHHNLIHDVYSYGEGTPGWGIYLGCRSRNSRVESNVVYRTRESVHIWYGNENTTWINNIFVDANHTQINYTNAKDTDHVNIRFLRNIVCWDDPAASLFIISEEHSLPEESDYNVYYLMGGGPVRIERLPGVENWEAWRARGFDARSVVADPLFVAPERDDYSLHPESPALKLGFQLIDLSAVGLRGSRWDLRR
ncbi:MAG: right-handed parallel beta-helix repeat-containing protein [Chloroflexi bacterium]|nr:right-handed parallel beta-helix repeat-containing protein [Chloroflexota bacterium]